MSDEIDQSAQFANRQMQWGGVTFVAQSLDREQVTELKRLHKWQETRRRMLQDHMLYRPAMYVGYTENDPRCLPALVLLIEWMMRDLCDLSTDKDLEDFFDLHGFGAVRLGKVVDINKAFGENREILKHWIKLFLDWIESPLDRIAKIAREPN